jgi:hypothetical protein
MLALGFVLAILPTGAVGAHEPETLPTAEPAALLPTPERPDSTETAIGHLLKAAAHLDAAGLKDEAQRLRQQARHRAVDENVVTRKEGELECLLEEIEQLRQLTGQPRSVVVYVTAMELSRAALGDRARELDDVLGWSRSIDDHESVPIFPRGENVDRMLSRPSKRALLQASASVSGQRKSYSIVDGNPMSHPLLRELREKGLIKILAQPAVMTASGRSASFLSGGQFPVKSKNADGRLETRWMHFGTQLNVHADILPGHLVRLQTKFEISETNDKFAVIVEGERIPGLSTWGINTDTELRFGQTAVVGGLSARSEKPSPGLAEIVESLLSTGVPELKEARKATNQPQLDDARETIVLITVESMDHPPTPRSVQLIPAEIEPDELRRLILPPGVPDDVQYFPASPIPRKGTLR